MNHAAIQRGDIARLRQLIARALAELPDASHVSLDDAHASASEYGHWSRRIPKYAMVNIGTQCATNPAGPP